MKPAKAAKELEKAITLVRNLIEHLRQSFGATSERTGERHDFIFLSQWGELALSGDDAGKYRECRDVMLGIHGANSSRRAISRRTVEKLLTDTLLRVLLPVRSGHADPRPKFSRRMERELRRLRRGLASPLRRWKLVVQVAGLLRPALPLELGRVRFVRGTKARGKELAANIHDYEPTRARFSQKRLQTINADRAKSRAKVAQMFSEHALALAEVAASDYAAAKQLGLVEIRQVVDVLNFFAPLFEFPRGIHRAYVAPEHRGARLQWLVYDPDGSHSAHNDEFADEWPISKLRLGSRQARQLGLVRVNDLLANETRTDLEDRIVTAIAWAGRARVEHRPEHRFLLYAIALEALLAKPNARSGVTERLRLRVAFLVHRKATSRKTLAATMSRLYDLRSSLVHAGTAEELADRDVDIIEHIVELAIVSILTKSPFKEMKNAIDFDRWFDDQLLGV